MVRGRRLVRAALVLLLIGPLVLLAVVDWRLSSALSRIDGAFDGLRDRPPAATDGSVTMLMLGTGDGTAGSPVLSWMPGRPTVLSAMFVTISGDRREADVDWLPLHDVVLTGLTDSKPSGVVAAAEAWTGRRVDHLAVVEWSAFSELGHDNGVPRDLPPAASRGEQQTFLRAVLDETLHTVMRKEPWLLYSALHTVAESMAVEEGWSTFDMFRLVVSLRDLRSAQIVFGALDEPGAQGG